MNHVSDIQWINTILNVGILPLLFLIHKLERSIDKLRLDVTEKFLTKEEYQRLSDKHERDGH